MDYQQASTSRGSVSSPRIGRVLGHVFSRGALMFLVTYKDCGGQEEWVHEILVQHTALWPLTLYLLRLYRHDRACFRALIVRRPLLKTPYLECKNLHI